eukprot:3866738-Rhodomonas_salina.1
MSSPFLISPPFLRGFYLLHSMKHIFIIMIAVAFHWQCQSLCDLRLSNTNTSYRLLDSDPHSDSARDAACARRSCWRWDLAACQES